ncbi:GntR family transcriptional regulator [Nesterenkonia lacusekhoensis]|uniref:DNA-binding GntR family transcriptional regulator n=1 Tax=Nesterenkonia lacusekhoensis TaxID=150832 RepID=A0ABS4T013_9MICC|nr:GntR family transcriptional regulator [Nesterenkonia lacusekhoensis]MBP2317790.1 DNA-binding GntR family transcriptional regulator [Nesterenkonia lacusekhoensis]
MRASDAAYTALRDDIVEGRLAPDTVLGEVEQSERLGVSRTPVREAFSRLTAAGLAVQAPGRGTVVSPISLADVDHLFELRIPLETQAAHLAALRAEPEPFTSLAEEFAAVAARGAGAERGAGAPPASTSEYYRLAAELDAALDAAVANPYLSTALQSLRVHLVRIRRLAQDEPQRLTASAYEHRDICRAIAAADPELARAATAVHLRRSLAYIKNAAENQTPQEDPLRKESVPS